MHYFILRIRLYSACLSAVHTCAFKTVSISKHYIISGFGGFMVSVLDGMYNLSIVCKKRRCPKITETRTIAAQSKLHHS